MKIAHASAGEVAIALSALREFRASLDTIGRGVGEAQVEIDVECVPAEAEEAK
ncbi:hypothetical protein D3C83_180580 [compost metagenome]